MNAKILSLLSKDFSLVLNKIKILLTSHKSSPKKAFTNILHGSQHKVQIGRGWATQSKKAVPHTKKPQKEGSRWRIRW